MPSTLATAVELEGRQAWRLEERDGEPDIDFPGRGLRHKAHLARHGLARDGEAACGQGAVGDRQGALSPGEGDVAGGESGVEQVETAVGGDEDVAFGVARVVHAEVAVESGVADRLEGVAVEHEDAAVIGDRDPRAALGRRLLGGVWSGRRGGAARAAGEGHRGDGGERAGGQAVSGRTEHVVLSFFWVRGSGCFGGDGQPPAVSRRARAPRAGGRRRCG